MGIFGDDKTAHELMNKPVSLDEILQEEKRIIEKDRALKHTARKEAKRKRRVLQSSHSPNPYDAHAAPSYTPDPDPPIEDPAPVVSPHRRTKAPSPARRPAPPTIPAVPRDEFEAAALAAYYSTYSRALQDRKTQRVASDGPYSKSDYGSRRGAANKYRSESDGYRRHEFEAGSRRIPLTEAAYPYRTGAENEEPLRNSRPRTTSSAASTFSVPSAKSPQFLPETLRKFNAAEKDNDAEVVCLGERVSSEVPPAPKMKSNIPILIEDDEDEEVGTMVDT